MSEPADEMVARMDYRGPEDTIPVVNPGNAESPVSIALAGAFPRWASAGKDRSRASTGEDTRLLDGARHNRGRDFSTGAQILAESRTIDVPLA